MTQRYYLFHSGKLTGPIGHEALERMRQNRTIEKYSWIMNEQEQHWSPVTEKPQVNPFAETKEALSDHPLRALFIHRNRPIAGTVTGIHTYGVEIWVTESPNRLKGLREGQSITLNLEDERGHSASNTRVEWLSMEAHPNGNLIRFAWIERNVA
jgi:hypothetical protein